MEPDRRSLRTLARDLRAGRESASALLAAALVRIAHVDPSLNAIVARDDAGARLAATDSDARFAAGRPLGPLDGIPCAIKDNLLVRGLPATWGSRCFADFVPEEDEAPVARLRAGGAVILAKTNVPEFTLRSFTANALHGVTRNPWNTALTPGGSSGGSAAAVAAGILPFSLATDGGGSIRRPAGHTGLVGLKPGRGAVLRGGGFPEINHDFEVVGPLARRVDDARLVFDWLAPQAAPAGAEARGPLRILCVRTIADAPVDPVIRASFDDALETLAAAGHTLTCADLPFDVTAANATLSFFPDRGLATMSRQQADFFDIVSAPHAQAARRGLALRAQDLARAVATVDAFRADVEAALAPYDIVATPATAAQPWPADEEYPPLIDGCEVGQRGHAIFTGWVNVCGRPAIVLPMSPAPDGLPVGLQLVGRHGSEHGLLDLAETLERTFRGPERWPPVRSTPIAHATRG